MTEYHLQFWRDQEQVFDFESDDFDTLDEAQRQVYALIYEMMTDPWGEDWTGCRFDIATAQGGPVLQVPILAAMSAIARRAAH